MRLVLPGLALLASALASGCAPALHEPRPVQEMGKGLSQPEALPVTAGDVDRLLAEAETRFARRPDPSDVSLAQQSFLLAARGDDTRVEGLVGLARVATWSVEHESDPKARQALVELALEAAQWCARRTPGRAECDYALARALGQQARERPTTAQDGLAKMVEALQRAIATDPSLDEAGPHRVLALVLVRAPGWPAGPGDSAEGLAEAQKAVALAPAHPPNQLALAEALRKNGRGGESRAAYGRALALAQARPQALDPDASEWVAEAQRALSFP